MRPRKEETLSRARSPLPRKSKGRNILGLVGARAILRIPEGLALMLKDTYLRLPGTTGQEGDRLSMLVDSQQQGFHRVSTETDRVSQQNPPVLSQEAARAVCRHGNEALDGKSPSFLHLSVCLTVSPSTHSSIHLKDPNSI